MAYRLTVGLTTWRAEINDAFPERDKTSDGWIGDAAHAVGTSGHNNENSGHAEFNDHDGIDEVRAIDVDKDLKNPRYTMEQLIQWLVALGRAGAYLPFRYFIFNKRIWRKSTGWKTQTYNGPNPHDHHAHFSGDFTAKADAWKGSLGLAAWVNKNTNVKAVKQLKFEVSVPEVGEGDRDDRLPSYDMITRIQKLKNLNADGIWGPATTKAVGAKKMTEKLYRDIFALGG